MYGVGACAIMTRYVEAEDKLQELAVSFHPMGPEDWFQAVKLGGKYLYPVGHLIIPKSFVDLAMAISRW